jgi:hypothetical protein
MQRHPAGAGDRYEVLHVAATCIGVSKQRIELPDGAPPVNIQGLHCLRAERGLACSPEALAEVRGLGRQPWGGSGPQRRAVLGVAASEEEHLCTFKPFDRLFPPLHRLAHPSWGWRIACLGPLWTRRLWQPCWRRAG